MKTFVLVLFLSATLLAGQTSKHTVSCENDTVDRWGESEASEAKAFLAQLKLATIIDLTPTAMKALMGKEHNKVPVIVTVPNE